MKVSQFVLVLMFLTSIACQKQAGTTETAPPPPATTSATTSSAPAAEKTYTMNGKLVSRDTAKNEVTIDNEEVPGGVMAPMVMAYELRGAKVATLPPDGSRITSTLHEKDGTYWVTDVKAKKR